MNDITIDWVVNAVVKKVVATYSLNGLEVDDLKSEGYLVALKRLPEWDKERGKLSSFLYQVVWGRLTYLCISQKESLELMENHLANSEEMSLETPIILNQIEEKLSDRDKKIFKMMRKGYTHSEIATTLNVTERTIGRLLNGIKVTYSS